MSEKLVRDYIPDIIRADGENPNIREATATERAPLLVAKVQEELAEFMAKPSAEEFGDVLEAMEALAAEYGITLEEAMAAQVKKFQERGGFAKGYVLKSKE
jgi:predicted house-cleaning noncanonical NTP pyrophosphatase (MazG superfamily)